MVTVSRKWLYASLLLAVPQAFACESTPQREYIVHPIFDENDAETYWFHRLANYLHIDTRQSTLENELAYLATCIEGSIDLDEVARHLRSKRYIRDAKVSLDNSSEQPVLKVETWDNWSLLPTLDFGRKGGKNHFAVGIKDRNLLGYGIDADFEYFSDAQRTGYKLDMDIPLYLGYNANALVRLVDNDDGEQIGLGINKPFVSLGSRWGGLVYTNHEKRVDTLFYGASGEVNFAQEVHQTNLSYGQLYAADDFVKRWHIGFEQEKHSFTDIPAELALQDRDLNFIWAGVEWLQNDFHVLQDVHLIGHIEDFNLGWQLKLSAGFSPSNNTTAQTWQTRGSVSKGFSLGENWLLLSKANWRWRYNNDMGHQVLASVQGESFYTLNKTFAWYTGVSLDVLNNAYADEPLTLGGDSDFRGLPLQYQHGERTVKITNELRYYPHINLWRLFELGGAAFYDVGRVSGDAQIMPAYPGWLQSVGIGARFFSTHSSDRQVVHIDLAHPIGDDPNLDNFEIRVEVKHAF